MKAVSISILLTLLFLSSSQAREISAELRDSYYNLHIIAVDRDGSALWPGVDETAKGFKARPQRMDGELLETEPEMKDGKPLFRKEYYEYIGRILREIERKRPKRVVFYIHGGMNFITGAIQKGAVLAEEMRGREDEEYRISICWSSNLSSTYLEHLTSNVDGLKRPMLGVITSPLTLLSDLGGAICDAPRTLVRIAMNDLHAARPLGFARDRRAYEREIELEAKPRLGMKKAIDASLGADERSNRPFAGAVDGLAWLGTKPAKVATAPLIDQLGSGAWYMMERRTRTMFERETQIATTYLHRREKRRGIAPVRLENGKPVRDHELTRAELEFNERAMYAARVGAVRLFFEQAEAYFVKVPKERRRNTQVALIGHSMGAIVTNEILARFINLDFDHIVYMAAACSVNDFARVGVPYLRQHKRARFYNLCLHPAAERSEAQPGKLMIADPLYLPLEIAPRGSLLVWIDSFLDQPASENDRTIGRWENAVLVADTLPSDILNRMTLKGFGRDRTPGNAGGLRYTESVDYRFVKSGGLRKLTYLAEPREHGQFSRRAKKGDDAAKPNFAFTDESFWAAEREKAPAPAAASRGKAKR